MPTGPYSRLRRSQPPTGARWAPGRAAARQQSWLFSSGVLLSLHRPRRARNRLPSAPHPPAPEPSKWPRNVQASRTQPHALRGQPEESRLLGLGDFRTRASERMAPPPAPRPGPHRESDATVFRMSGSAIRLRCLCTEHKEAPAAERYPLPCEAQAYRQTAGWPQRPPPRSGPDDDRAAPPASRRPPQGGQGHSRPEAQDAIG